MRGQYSALHKAPYCSRCRRGDIMRSRVASSPKQFKFKSDLGETKKAPTTLRVNQLSRRVCAHLITWYGFTFPFEKDFSHSGWGHRWGLQTEMTIPNWSSGDNRASFCTLLAGNNNWCRRRVNDCKIVMRRLFFVGNDYNSTAMETFSYSSWNKRKSTLIITF